MQTEGGLNSGSLQMAVLIYALYRRTENQWDEEPSCCSHKLIYGYLRFSGCTLCFQCTVTVCIAMANV